MGGLGKPIIEGSRVNISFEAAVAALNMEANHLMDQMELETLKLIEAGYPKNLAMNEVLRQMEKNEGFMRAWTNRVNRVIAEQTKGLIAKPVEHYAEKNKDLKFHWVLGSVKTQHCPDCLRLSKMEPKNIQEWREMGFGLPREGGTKCNVGCQCMLSKRPPSKAQKAAAAESIPEKEIEKTLDNAFTNADNRLKSLIKKVGRPKSVRMGDFGDEVSHYSSFKNEVVINFGRIGKYKKKHGDYDTIRHEYGHFLDDNIFRRLKRGNTSVVNVLRQELEAANNMMKMNSAAKRNFTKTMRESIGDDLYYADLLGGITRGRVGHGHEISYYKKLGGDVGLKEAVANLFAIKYRKDQSKWKYIKKQLPELANAFEKLIKEVS